MNDPLVTRLAYALVACLVLAACDSGSTSDTAASQREVYKPGMGDLMSALQLRHAKLWYAGRAENWPLAAFELHEIEETLERIERWHPEEDGLQVAPALESFIGPAHHVLGASVANKDRGAFEAAFDDLTQGCNACHQAMKHEFIVIQRPTREPVTNQRWAIEP
jgi:hypothetical protein